MNLKDEANKVRQDSRRSCLSLYGRDVFASSSSLDGKSGLKVRESFRHCKKILRDNVWAFNC